MDIKTKKSPKKEVNTNNNNCNSSINFNAKPDHELKEIWKKEQLKLKEQLITEDQFDFDINSIWPKPPEECKKPTNLAKENDMVQNITPKEEIKLDQTKQLLKRIGGVDISFVKGSQTEAVACLVVLSFPDLNVIYKSMEVVQLNLPYISGFLAFREVDHLLKLVQKLREKSPELLPQIILVDGNGILHHRGFGLASHFGVLSGIPTIGIGKSFLAVDGMTLTDSKKWTSELKNEGSYKLLIGKSKICWGAVLRGTRKANVGIFVSIGHRISLKSAISIAYRCSLFKIPEPVRKADLLSRDFVKDNWDNQEKPKKKNYNSQRFNGKDERKKEEKLEDDDNSWASKLILSLKNKSN